MKRNLYTLTLLAAAAGVCGAQTGTPNFTFRYRAGSTGDLAAISPQGTIRFPATNVGAQAQATFVISSQAAGSWTLVEGRVGGSAFSSVIQPGVRAPGQDAVLTITFAPSQRGAADGNLSFTLQQGDRTATYIFFLNGTGAAADLATSYVINPNGNQTSIADGETLRFPAVLVDQSATATVIITNRGTGPGRLDRVTTSGSAFRITNLPLLPATIAPDRELRFNVVFTPSSRELVRAQLRMEFESRAIVFQLEGEGLGSLFQYELSVGGNVVPVLPNGSVDIPETAVNSVRPMAFVVRNTGNVQGTLRTIAVTGTGFTLGDLPALPANIPAGGQVVFTIVFSPREAGPITGRLRVEDATFQLNGNGLGPRVTLALVLGGQTIAVPAGGTILFPNTSVASVSEGELILTNEGNQPALTRSISLAGEAFIIGLPGLPMTLEPLATVRIPLAFRPNALGALTGTLDIDETRVSLRGTGITPAALPEVTFMSGSAPLEPLRQPEVGLAIGTPYPVDLTGKLNLSFVSESFADDPAIQFASGGRTVDFRIPANTREAIFGAGARQLQFQTGTVAGQIVLSASFAIGGVDITPVPVPSRAMMIQPSAPSIRSVQVGTRTATSFELLVTGYSTSRTVNQMNFEFTAAPGFNLATRSVSADVQAAFSSWYQSANSRNFGSQFTAAIRVDVAGDVNALQSVSITASNGIGTSAAASVGLR
jgi:hypothetical protein